MHLGTWVVQVSTFFACSSSNGFRNVLGMREPPFTGGRPLSNSGVARSNAEMESITHTYRAEGEAHPRRIGIGTGSSGLGVDQESRDPQRKRKYHDIGLPDSTNVSPGKIGELDRLQRCYSKTMADLRGWKQDIVEYVSKASMPTTEEDHYLRFMEEEMNLFITQVDGLFKEKKSQLKTPRGPAWFKSKEQFEELITKFLQFVAHAEILPNRQSTAADEWRHSMYYRWCELKMILLSDLIKNDILPGHLVSNFFNQEPHGSLLWQYISSRLYITAYSMYLSFDLKLSLQEDPSTQRFINVLELLTPGTWKKIEFENVLVKLDLYEKQFPPGDKFCSISAQFRQLKVPSTTKINFLFKSLANYISFWTKMKIEKFEEKHLQEMKMLYDMLTYLLCHHAQDISTEVIQSFNSNSIFYEVRVFEEFVGLIGSAYYLTHARLKNLIHSIIDQSDDEHIILQSLPEKISRRYRATSKYLTDSNQNRKISNLDRLDKEGFKNQSKVNTRTPHHSQFIIQKTINQYVESGSQVLQESAIKWKKQLESYEDSVKLHNQSYEGATFDPKELCILDGSASKVSQWKIKELEELWNQF